MFNEIREICVDLHYLYRYDKERYMKAIANSLLLRLHGRGLEN